MNMYRHRRIQGPDPLFCSIILGIDFHIVASEEMHSIDFYGGSKKKNSRGEVQFEILNKSRYRLS